MQVLQIGTSVLEARDWRLSDEALRTVREHAGPIAVVTEGDPGGRFPELAEIGLSPELANCRAIDSTLTPAGPGGLHACDAARQPPAPLMSPFWAQAARRYRTLYQPGTPADDMIATAYLQAAGPAARGTRFLDWADLLWGGMVRDRAALPATLDPDTLYVATSAYAAALTERIDPAHDMLGQADGWVIAAPGWRTCADCTATLPPPTAGVPPLGPGSPGPFAADTLRAGAFGDGWWLDGDPSVWSGATATLRVPIAANIAADATLVLRGVAFTAPGLPGQRVIAAVAGHTLATTILRGSGAIRVPFTPAQLVPAPDGSFILPLQLSCPDATSPAALGVSPDPRVLGFALTSIRLE